MSVGLMMVATRKYNRYVEPLVESAREYFNPDGELHINLMSDVPHNGIEHLEISSVGFPDATLYRYHYILKHFNEIRGDYLFYCDVDMRFVDAVGAEVLSELTAVQHPGFWRGGGSWEDRSESTAYVPPTLRDTYYAGGFWGGTRTAILDMVTTLATCINLDSERGITAVWHDESHLNRYLCSRPPLELSPSYCYPESWDLPFEKKLLALDKNHAEVRS